MGQFLKKALLIFGYRSLGMLGRLANDPESKVKELKKTGKNLLFCVWHESTAACFYYYRNRQAGYLREDSPKGEVLAAMSRHFGYSDFAISDDLQDRKSIKGTIQFIKYLREGHDGVIAMDGPNGPYHVPKTGVFSIAQKTNSLIVPVGVWYEHKILLKKRWDKYQVPLPFSKYKILVGDPFPIPEKIDNETVKQEIEKLAARVDELNLAVAE